MSAASMPPPSAQPDASARVRALHAKRPRSRLAWGSVWVLCAATVFAWGSLSWSWGRLFAPADKPGLRRFLQRDAMPFPLRDEGSTWRELGPWLANLWHTMGQQALLSTLWIALAASVLAGAFALLVAPLANHRLMAARPYESQEHERGRGFATATRLGCLAMRGIPEYVLAFLLITLLTHSVWPAVLALAIHNGGILGRLFGETLEDVPSRPLQALRGAGARRSGLWLFGGAPQAFQRWLAFYFYRLETCVREATVLGMLGIISIGYYVKELRARQFYDEMLVLVALGGLLVMVADGVSGWVRGRLQR